MAAESHSPPTPRLNPFALPADTDFRFALLMVVVLAASIFMYANPQSVFMAIFSGETKQRDEAIKACVQDALSNVNLHSIGQAQLPAAFEGMAQCIEPHARNVALSMLTGMTVLLGLAAGIYWASPAWRFRQRQLQPLNVPDMEDCLVDLCRRANLPRQPLFLWEPLRMKIDGVAFSRLGRYYVALSAGSTFMFFTVRPIFDAVVLHELAHLRNVDVNKGVFAAAISLAFAVAALLPYGMKLLLVVDQPLQDVLSLAWRVLALTALVYLTFAAVLRARELYADARTWGWEPAGVRRWLDAGAHAVSGRWLAMLRPYLGRLLDIYHVVPIRWLTTFQFHPDLSERRRFLEDADRLFRVGFWDALGAGVGGTIALLHLVGLLMYVALAISGANIGQLALLLFILLVVGTLPFMSLALGAVNAGVWRAALVALVRGGPPRGIIPLGFGLGLGLVLGVMLSLVPGLGYFDPGFGLTEQHAPISWALLLSVNALWSVFILMSVFLFLRWMMAAASVWIELALRRPSPRLAYYASLGISSGVLAWWFGVLVAIYISARILLPFLSGSDSVLALGSFLLLGFAGFALNPVSLIALISLWAFPLAAWFWIRRLPSTSESPWAFMEQPPHQLTLQLQPPFRLGLASVLGLAGGLVFCGVLLIFGITLLRAADALGVERFAALVASAVLLQAGVAAIAACSIGRLGALHGLFAAFVGGCVITAGILGFFLLHGREFSSFIFFAVVNVGALLALPAALGGSAVAGWFRRTNPSNSPPQIPEQ
jgi:hypothetical protein